MFFGSLLRPKAARRRLPASGRHVAQKDGPAQAFSVEHPFAPPGRARGSSGHHSLDGPAGALGVGLRQEPRVPLDRSGFSEFVGHPMCQPADRPHFQTLYAAETSVLCGVYVSLVG